MGWDGTFRNSPSAIVIWLDKKKNERVYMCVCMWVGVGDDVVTGRGDDAADDHRGDEVGRDDDGYQPGRT